ncbi:SET and MYND domain-containing protein 4-like isoform X1 [Neodiprion virginianus]|uniref:SET and MYND domain-containing protein 4-like isoform X1 n=1 Tax=Neodiprion virginianus TaxID=2961670 RepID=UPI001EE7029A|nr:SET and MYND domain-containing protein 4-like isoform X1 [Neodiprion virginianus]XP_046605332.1 SET and MYND domain-containing protein 4-like isoform X1 [Neodiprion virginianus]XP_046605342.1 SET and MYND domain-containing protein 4-like isoform X1 [Neodiprion virginianus]XP_046605352.1 SET and MYND domain-containing protein 4-like isoform X1 [Neodiprion virginianus]XP_046605359.1 SET and MYND domain-containing protein 4-like isoform X1 [Neodiprion virginianus]
MDQAKQLVLALKQNNKSHVGYGLQQESEALVSHILQNMVKSSLPRFKPKMKNSKDSMRYREEGNQRFVSGEDIEAIESYTKSLAYADSPELMAYAYANRSAALYRKQLYEECLIDINAALSLDYPASKKKKLQERGQNAMSAVMKRTSKSNGKLHDMNRIENNHSSDTESKEKCASDSSVENDVCEKFTLIPDMGFEMAALERSLTESNITCDVKNFSINSLDCKTSRDIEIPEYLANEGLPQLAYGPSKEAPSASDGVQITYSEKFGRHLIATKAFKPGDVIAAEKPFASVIYAERYYTHCNHCLSKCYNLIACPNCPMALYCSNHCQKLAWAAAHQIECRIISLLPNLLNVDEDKIRMLTKIMRLLIMVTQNGMLIDELRKDTEVAESNSDSRTAGFTDDGKLDSFNSRSALSLATNMTSRPLIGISAFACISSLAVLLLAVETDFFKKKFSLAELKDVSMYADIPFCGAIMLRACVIMSSNCFSIQQDPGIKSGSGLYVLHSLQNHSCAPNTFRHFEGLTMITRALEPIAVGEQIFTCYGTAHGCMPRNERKKKIMEEYFFECECPACYNDWPSYKEILENHIGSITKNKDLVQKLKPFKKKLLKNKYDIHAVKSIIEILHEETTKPCEEMIHAIQFLKSYYLGVDLTAA